MDIYYHCTYALIFYICIYQQKIKVETSSRRVGCVCLFKCSSDFKMPLKCPVLYVLNAEYLYSASAKKISIQCLVNSCPDTTLGQ